MNVKIANRDAKSAALLGHAFDQGKLAHSYLFCSQNTESAIATAYWLACLFNCTGTSKPDGTCRNCRQIISGNHPDVLLVAPEGKQSLGIDQIRFLKAELAKSPVQSATRFFVIKDAQKLTLAAANALLNLLEEPVAPVVTILISTNLDQILPTIRSRTQIINFGAERKSSGRAELLADNGFNPGEIAELGDTKNLDQASKYFYQEMLERSGLALVSAHKLAEMAKSRPEQDYLLLALKERAQADLKNDRRQLGARMLKVLLKVDQMRYSNVGFRNLLDYLALQWKR